MNARFSWLLLPAAALLSRGAAAEERHRMAWWIDAQPWTCVDFVAPLAHQVALSCDAAGGRCRVASSEAEAERHAVLRCAGGEGGGWTLEARGAKGEHLWAVDLAGEEDEKLRRAAMWVARAEGDGPIDAGVPQKAPLQPSSAQAPKRENEANEADEAERPKTKRATNGGFTLSGSAAYETSEEGPAVFGARAAFAMRVAGTTYGVLSVDGAVPTKMNVRPFSYARAAVGAAWGAPWTDDVLGASVEVGAAAVHTYWEDSTRGAPYGAVSLTAQYPGATLRPFIRTSLAVYATSSNPYATDWSIIPGPMVGVDAGLAWSAW
jgi:hypothetical protein